MNLENGNNLLRNIEERLEQISEAINKIDDDSNDSYPISYDFRLWDKKGSVSALELIRNNTERCE